jgi:hypothetical protein
MNSLDWRLNELCISPDCFTTLDDWFNRGRDRDEGLGLNAFMEYYYWRGVQSHPRNITKFTRGDYLDNRNHPGKKIWWRRQMARRLFGLRKAVTERSRPIDRFIKAHYPNKHFLRNHFWLLHNCQPCLGHWSAENRGLYTGKNPTGYPCHSRLCPWCWLRRFEIYIKICRASQGYPIIAPGLRVCGIGLPSLINVTSFDYFCDTEDATEQFFNESFEFYGIRAAQNFKQIRQGPWDPYLLRLTAPIFREMIIDGQRTTRAGIRVGFLHTDTVPAEAVDAVTGLRTFNNVTVEDAIRWTYPFPIGWLESDDFVQVKLRLLTCFHGLTHHGVRKVALARTKDGHATVRY